MRKTVTAAWARHRPLIDSMIGYFLLWWGIACLSPLTAHSAGLMISPVDPWVNVTETLPLAATGAVEPVIWTPARGQILGEGQNVNYQAPDAVILTCTEGDVPLPWIRYLRHHPIADLLKYRR